jgi:hypothetical protein
MYRAAQNEVHFDLNLDIAAADVELRVASIGRSLFSNREAMCLETIGGRSEALLMRVSAASLASR